MLDNQPPGHWISNCPRQSIKMPSKIREKSLWCDIAIRELRAENPFQHLYMTRESESLRMMQIQSFECSTEIWAGIASNQAMQIGAVPATRSATTAVKMKSNSWPAVSYLLCSAISRTEKFMEQMGTKCSWPSVPGPFHKQIQVNTS